MAAISYATKEINAKIVYYGPGMSGKTTNLRVIYEHVPANLKSNMISLSTEGERTLFFDFLPLDLGHIKSFKIKLQLYTVPGQVYYNATRKLVLRGVDGIVFVADSAPDKMPENIASLQNLYDNFTEYKYIIEDTPTIFQYNKRDLQNAVSIDELNHYLNQRNLLWNEAVASQGTGVFDSLKTIGKLVVDQFNKKYLQPAAARPSYTIHKSPQKS
jgi:signal recognition particle receptor subunit beta